MAPLPIVCVALALLGAPVAARGTGDSALASKTLTRFHDPVIIETSALAGLDDQDTDHYRLYSAKLGELVPIPYQFDARDESGDVELAVGTAMRFDDNDELVFMVKDSGDRIGIDSLPPHADAVMEIVKALRPLSETEREWVLQTAVSYLESKKDGNGDKGNG